MDISNKLLEREIRIKRLLYQSWYRGCKETDIILGDFARENIYNFTDEELNSFEEILKESDKHIVDWKCGNAEVPEKYKNDPVLKMLLSI